MPILAILLLLTTAAHAEAASYKPAKIVRLDPSNRELEKKLQLLKKKVELTPDQLHRAKEALVEQNTRLDQLQKEADEARRKILENTDGTMKGILNPSQQEKYSLIREDVVGKLPAKIE